MSNHLLPSLLTLQKVSHIFSKTQLPAISSLAKQLARIFMAYITSRSSLQLAAFYPFSSFRLRRNIIQGQSLPLPLTRFRAFQRCRNCAVRNFLSLHARHIRLWRNNRHSLCCGPIFRRQLAYGCALPYHP
jgi:hypothetical protein